MRKSLITFALTLAMLLMSVGIKAQTVYFSEDFSDFTTSGVGSSWNRSDNDPSTMATTYQWKGSASGHDGYCAYSYMYGATVLKARLKSPTFTLPSMTSCIISFWMKGGTSATNSGILNIYYSTDGGNTYLPNVIVSDLKDTTVWTKYTFAIPAACTGAVNLVFEAVGSASTTTRYIYLDQLEVKSAPTCQSPAGLYIEGLTANSASFNWGLDTTYTRFGASVPTQYAVTLKDSNDNVVYYNNAVTTKYVNFTGLMGNATYTASVLSDCETGSSLGYTDSFSIQFNTLPPAVNPPFFTDFESFTQFPNGYYYKNASIATTAYQGTQSAKLTTTAANEAYIIFPLLNIPANNIEMDFFMRSAATKYVSFQTGYMTDPTDQSTFIPVVLDSIPGDNEWHNFRFNTSAVPDVTSPVMPCIYINSGVAASLYLDNVGVNTISSCTRPEHVSFTGVTSSQATVAWDMSNATSYTVNVMALSDSTVTTYTNCQNPYTVTGLRQNAYYAVTVQGSCSGHDSSDVSIPGFFRTECAPVADTPIFFEGAEFTSGNALPDCWVTDSLTPQNPGTSGSIYPVPFYTQSTASNVHTGTRSFQLRDQKSGAISYLCSQGFNFEERGKYTFRYWMYRPTGTTAAQKGEGLKVFVTPTVGDTTNAVVVIPLVNRLAGFEPVESKAGWYEYEGIINYQGVGHIMIVGYSRYGLSTYFDDMQILLTPNCPKVSAIKSSDITSTSAKVSWTPGNTETQWIVDYSIKQGTTDILHDTIVANDSNFVVSGLLPQTGYTIYGTVRALCGANDTAEAVSFTFPVTTLCAPMSDIPYTYGFEDAATGTSAAFPTCWNRFNDATSTTNYYPYVYSSTTYFHGGSKGLYFYTSTTASYAEHQIAILPQVDTAAYPMNTLRLKFWAKRSTTASNADAPMIVGVMSDPANLSTFEVIDTLVVSNSANQQEFVANFSNYRGNGTFPAIRLDRQTSACYCYVDDITLEELPNCLEIGATVSDNEATSVRITIDDSTAVAGWSYAYGPEGTDLAYMVPVDTTGMSIVLEGLNVATKYDLYVRRNCGREYSEWSQKISFFTTSIPATIPYICDFEDTTEVAQWHIIKGAAANIFVAGSVASAVHTGSKAMYVSNDNGVSNVYGHTSSRNFAYRTIHFDAKQYQIELFLRCVGGETASTGSTTYDYGRIMLVPVSETLPEGASGTSITASNPGGFPASAIFFDVNDKGYINLLNDEWYFVSKNIDFTANPGNYNLVLVWNNDGSGGTTTGPLSVDDITISEVGSCVAPESAVSATSNSVTVDVSQASATEWEFVFDTVSFSKLTIPANPLYRRISTTGTETFAGLTPNTSYYYAVRSICSTTDTSLWSTPAEVRTFCSSYNVPYTEGFEDASTISCWTLMSSETAGVSMEPSTAYHHNGLVSLKAVKAVVITPEYAVDSLTHYMVNGWVYSTVDSTSFGVGVIVNPNDPETYENISTVFVPAKNTWTEFTAYFTDLADPEYAEFKNAKNIAIACGNNTFYFDDIMVDETPTCPKPTEPRISNIQAHSFDISFVDNAHGSASQWIVYANDSAYVINSTTATITGLDAHALYHVSVAALCAGNDTSHLTDCGNIVTACDAMPTPWSCGFETSEGYEGGTSYDPETTANFESNCWNVFNQKPNGATYPYAYVTTTASYVHTGTQAVYTYTGSAATENLYMVLPGFSDPSNMLKVKFWYKNGGATTTYSQLIFGYFTDASSDTTFVPVDTMQRYTAWTEKEIFTNTARYNMPANVRIGFLIDKAGSYGYGLYLDDISVNLIRSCSDPNAPTVSDITASSANVAFTDTCSTHAAWEYVYGPRGFNPNNATPVSVDTTVFSINGLTNETSYDVYVRAVCGVGDVSNYVKASFTTLCLPFAVTENTPFSDGFEDLTYNVSLAGCYTVEGNYTSGSTYYHMKGASKNATTIYSHSGDMCLHSYLYPSQSPKGQTAYRQFQLTAGKVYKASVWVRTISYPGAASILFGSKANVDSMSVVASATPSTCTSSSSSFMHCWEQMSGYIAPEETGTYFIALHNEKPSTSTSSYAYMYFDDFTVQELAGCLPTVVTVDSATVNTVYAHYADTVAENTYEAMVMNGTDTIVAPTLITSNPFSVSGLPSSSSLTLYVRQSCEGGNYSEWSTDNFNTACGAINDYPYTQNFEGTFPPVCWSQFYYGTTTAYAWTTSTTASYVHSGSKSAYISYSSSNGKAALVTGEFNLTNPYGYYVRLWSYRSAATSYPDKDDEALHIGYLNAPITAANISSVNEIGVIHRNPTNPPVETGTAAAYYEYEFEVPAGVTGPTWFSFDFHSQNGLSYAFDDLTIEPIPSCVTPKDAPEVVSTTMTTATVTVNMRGKSEAQVVWMNPTDLTTVIGTVSTNNGVAVVTGLTGTSQYAFMYRYICEGNDTSAWSPVGLGLTKSSDCFVPENVRLVGEAGTHNATVTWGGAPDAAAYKYVLSIGGTVVDSAVVTSDTVALNGLYSNVEYTFKVSALCQTDTTAYQSFNFQTEIETFNAPFVCDFEDVQMNNNWTMRRLSTTTTATNAFTIGNSARAGSKSMYISSDNVNYAYNNTATVTDAELYVNIPAGNYYVDYDWNCTGRTSGALIYDYGRVFLVPANYVVTGTTYSAFNAKLPDEAISLDGEAPILGSEGWTHFTQMLKLDSAASYKLVVLWANSTTVNGSPMAIDNFSIEEITCMPVKSVNVFSLDTTEAVTVISRNDSADVYYALSQYDSADSISNWTLATADTITFTGLTPNSTYYFFARRSCSATEYSRAMMVSFTTTVNPVRTPFVSTFETDDPNLIYWNLTSGSATNYFVIGSDASAEGSRSLYVTNDGSANAYSGSTNQASWSYAYVPLQFTSGTFEVNYSWRCAGESTYDYGHAFLAPASMIPQDNVQLTGMAAATLPAGCIALDAEYTKLNLRSDWVNASAEVKVANAGAYNLIIAWHNDASTVNQPPLAIDDLSITRVTCVKPETEGVSLDSVSDNMIRIKVKDAVTPILYHVASDASFTDTAAYGVLAMGDTIITATGLSASNLYYVHLASICSATNVSSFVTLTAQTECGVRTVFPYSEGFESYEVGTSTTNNDVLDDACWLVGESTTSAYYYVSSTASYTHTGKKGLYIYNTATSGATQTFAMPKVDTLAGKQLSMWYKNYSASEGYAVLEAGYLTNPDNTATFTVVATAPVVTGSFAEFVVDYPATIPANARPAFRANGMYYMYIDDIRINKVVTGTVYNDMVCFGGGYNEHGFNCPAGTLIPGDTTLTSVARTKIAGTPDSTVSVNLHVLNEIVVNYFDTICAGEAYTKGLWNIQNPTTRVYPRTFTSVVTGCDSVVNLSLYVCPTQVVVRDTICQGDSRQFYGQTCTQTGSYVAVDTNKWGCTDTVTLYLLVVDSTQVTNATICQGQSYTFEGQEYTQTGTYHVPSTGIHGCPLDKILNLTVTTTDSICNVSFCKGGSVMVADTTITTPGSYILVRVNPAGCDVTYDITATQVDPTPSHNYDYACEGHLYYGYGLSGIVVTKDTVAEIHTRTLDAKCDSVSFVHLTYVAIKRTYESAQIVPGDVYHWNGRDLTEEGNYQADLQSVEGCDSIVYLTLTYKGVGVENVADIQMNVIPNPVTAGQTSFVYGNFGDVKTVEVLNSFGQVIETFVPESYPIEVQGINAAGIYFVRVTTSDDKVAIQKLIVK